MMFSVYVHITFISIFASHRCGKLFIGCSTVHRKETSGTSLKNFNQLCNVSCQECQVDQEYPGQNRFLPNLPWHGTDYNMINRFSATNISGFWTWPLVPCWPWGWRIPIIQIRRIGMSDRLDGFSCVFDVCLMICWLFCVYIISSISAESEEIIGILLLQVQRISLLVSSLFPKLGLLRATKVFNISDMLNLWDKDGSPRTFHACAPLLKKKHVTCLLTWL